jgi:hypothetical protein
VSGIHVFPLLSSAIIVAFAVLVFRRYAARRAPHLLIWGIGLLLYGLASGAEAYSAAAWSAPVFRVWYLAGAVLSAAWIGHGTVLLLAGVRLPNLLVALVLGYAAAAALFLGAARLLGQGTGLAAVLIAFHGIIFGGLLNRVLVRHWTAQRLALVLTMILLAGSAAAVYLVFTLPLDASAFDPQLPLSVQYREILPADAGIRRLTPLFNVYGTLALAGGALYSAWLLRRREILPHRVAGNICIAAGAMVIASAGAMTRFGLGEVLSVAEVLAAALMFAGFLLATGRAPARQAPEGARA